MCPAEKKGRQCLITYVSNKNCTFNIQ
jgi:hypothetical protein